MLHGKWVWQVCVQVQMRPLKDRGGQVLIGLNVLTVRPLKDRGGQVLIGLNVVMIDRRSFVLKRMGENAGRA